MILDPELIPAEIKAQIEYAATDLGKGFLWISDPTYDPNALGAGLPEPAEDPRAMLLASGFQKALTAFAMLIL